MSARALTVALLLACTAAATPPVPSAQWAAGGAGLLVLVGPVEAPELRGAPLLDPLTLLGRRGRWPVPQAPSAATTLTKLAEAQALFESQPRVELALARIDEALAALPTFVADDEAQALAQRLVEAAQIEAVAKRSPSACLQAMARLLPDTQLDTSRVSPELIADFERERAGVTLPVAPAGCRWQVDQLRDQRPERVHAVCPNGRSLSRRLSAESHSLGGEPAPSADIASWELTLSVEGRALRVPNRDTARALVDDLLRDNTREWAAVLVGRPVGGYDLWIHRGGDAVKSRVSEPELALALSEAARGPEVFVPLDDAAQSGAPLPWWTWTLLGVGAGTLVAGGAVHAVAANTIETRINGGEDALDELQAQRTAYWTLYGTGGATLLAGIVLALIDASGTSDPAPQVAP